MRSVSASAVRKLIHACSAGNGRHHGLQTMRIMYEMAAALHRTAVCRATLRRCGVHCVALQDLMADPLLGLSAGGALGLSGVALGQNAAGAQGVLVKDILSAEEELRVS
jgi:hypothetical protein